MSTVHISPDEYMYPAIGSFDDLLVQDPVIGGLDQNLLRGIYAYGFEMPSAMQKRGLRPILDGRDTILQAKSGGGKTAAYIIGILQQIDVGNLACQALVLVPTHDVAVQIRKVVLGLGEFMKVKCHACLSGVHQQDDMDRLRAGQHCVVGTPGVVNQMIRQRHLRVDSVRVLVLDAADDMLSRGFRHHVYETFRALPANLQVCSCAAALGNEMVDLTLDFMRDAVQVWEKEDALPLQAVRQFYLAIELEEWKSETLWDLLEMIDSASVKVIVYCNTRRKVDFVTQQMSNRELQVSAMHRDLDGRERDKIMREFRSGAFKALISVDEWCQDGRRFFDDDDVHLVINYDFPQAVDTYLPRVGRVAARGRKRTAISFVTNDDVLFLKEIERHLGTEIEEMPMDIVDLI